MKYKKLFILLIIFHLIPSITDIIKTIIINLSENNISILNIAAQIEWFDLINETITTFLFVPIYFILTKFSKEEKPIKYFKFGIISFVIYFVFTLIVYFKVSSLSSLMEVPSPEAIIYLRIEAIAFLCGLISTYFIYVLIIENGYKLLLMYSFIKIVLISVFYLFAVKYFGVNGIAWSNVLVNVLLGVTAIVFGFKNSLLKVSKFCKEDLSWIKNWFHKGSFAGGQVFIDNIFYALIIVRLVNMVSQQGIYWMVNNFIWGILLIPSIVLGELVKEDVHNHKNLKFYWPYKTLGFVVLILVLTIPLWRYYFEYILNIPELELTLDVLYKIAPFYIFQMLSTVLDSKLFGDGKTYYNFVSSIIINFGYYGLIYVYTLLNQTQMTIDSIVYMFGGSMVVHFIFSLSFVFFERLKNAHQRIK